mmetsp:Transcript_45779/g.118330  ORF Transcript_45779/g.118330 Transcript_45779/m.118330 type:complete len:141 (-) Transcript_45779:268-690(-)
MFLCDSSSILAPCWNFLSTMFRCLVPLDDFFPFDLYRDQLQAYQVQKDTLRDRLSLFSLSLPSYHTLRWRMDVQVASKNMKGQSDPLFSLQLQLSDEKGKVVAHSLCSDVTNLKAVTSSLDEALKSARGPHMKRIQRFMS